MIPAVFRPNIVTKNIAINGAIAKEAALFKKEVINLNLKFFDIFIIASPSSLLCSGYHAPNSVFYPTSSRTVLNNVIKCA